MATKAAASSPPKSPPAAVKKGEATGSSTAAVGKKGEKSPPPPAEKKGSVASPPGSPPPGGKKGSVKLPPGPEFPPAQDASQPRISLSREPTPLLAPPVLPLPLGIAEMLHPEDAQFREKAAASTQAEVAPSMTTLSFMAAGALAEIHRVFNRCEMSKNDPSKKIVREVMLARANNIVLHGVGREGLMMRGFTMRLFHLGLKASCLGDMTCPKLGPGDLFIASAGPGEFSSVNALMLTAKEAGAKVLLVTAQPEGTAAKIADVVAWVPAQTMKDEDPEAGQLPVDRPWDRHSIPGRPIEQLHAFHRSFKPLDISEQPLPGEVPAMVDKRRKEEAKKGAEDKLADSIRKGQGPIDYSKKFKEDKDAKARERERKKKGLTEEDEEDEEIPSPKSPKSPKNSGKEPKGELGVVGIPGKEPIPHYMIPLEGKHIDREIIEACKGEKEYICLLAENKILPMGSLYEGAMYVLFEIVTFMLRVKLNESVKGMVSRLNFGHSQTKEWSAEQREQRRAVMMQLCLPSSVGASPAPFSLKCRCQGEPQNSTVNLSAAAIPKPKTAQFCRLENSIPSSFAAFLLPVAAACTVLTAYPVPVEAGILSGSSGLESLELPSLPKPEFLKKIQEENQKKYADFDARLKASPYIQGLLKKSKENAAMHRKEIEDKYCERGAEWGVGDCSLNGIPQADREAFLEALRKGRSK
ncbi:hypothetical protein R1sor_024478 [Riccia sorocarpa]|uniref:SIS domain-containing protein n=1 Tax=Riccia sorocarpa TaxID=122646 RepID=A0ABD3GSV8_9MARC